VSLTFDYYDMLRALDRSADRTKESFGLTGWQGSAEITRYDRCLFHMHWRHGPYKIRDHVFPGIFQIAAIELSEDLQRKGHVTRMLRKLLERGYAGDIRHLYIGGLLIENCGPSMSNLIKTRFPMAQQINSHDHAPTYWISRNWSVSWMKDTAA
jgi:hypothetical protein